MIKHFALLLMFLGSQWSCAQNSDIFSIEQTVRTFFEGFHAKDSVIIQSTLHRSFELGSVFKTQNGVMFQHTEGRKFINTVISRPELPEWKEVLGEFKINISGSLSSVWVPYEFWLDNSFSHCGVNSIHLIKTELGWKILNITDSRLKSCD